jgi:cytochrome c553
LRHLVIAAIAGASLVVSAAAGAAGDAAAGKSKSVVCAACHGADGNSANPMWPHLAGQHAPYLVKQMKDFKSGARKDPVMAPMAKPLSDQDMENLAAYFASQKQK